MGMEQLSDELLVQAYIDAVNLKLSPDFIIQLEAEIKCRGLEDRLTN